MIFKVVAVLWIIKNDNISTIKIIRENKIFPALSIVLILNITKHTSILYRKLKNSNFYSAIKKLQEYVNYA